MNIDKEFATIDAVLASGAETRGVDAFALAVIKAERQMRKLFTFLIFQSDAFGSDDVVALRNALANRRVYFRDFVAAWDTLCLRRLREIVGPDHDRLRAILDEAIEWRNKIFHGQLTSRRLSRQELIAYADQIRHWCGALATGAQRVCGYDGFGRNSFRKSHAKANLLSVQIRSIKDYDQLLAEMEKDRKRHSLGSALVTSPKNGATMTSLLVEKFPSWLSYFESHVPFRRFGQLEYHREAIERRFELGSASGAVTDERFQRALYRTLQAWGIGSRGSRLKPFEEFSAILSRQQQAVIRFENLVLDDPLLDVSATTDALWALMSELPIVENAAILVPVTKALHHVLPDLIVPMDREYTQMFFGWQNPQFQYGQRDCFSEAFRTFANVARAVEPSQFVNRGWNSSRTKVIDNALIGLLRTIRNGETAVAG